MSALCLYSYKDESFRSQLETYLAILYQSKILQYPIYKEVDEYVIDNKGPRAEAAQTDILILLVTAHFLASDFCYSAELRQLIEEKNRKNISIIPLIFTECNLEKTQLRNLERLPCNDLPLVNEYTRHFEQPLLMMSRELEMRIQRARYYKHQVEEGWKQASSVDEVNTYRSFLKIFPHCPYASLAQNRLDEMVEAKLWKEAESFDNMEYLFNYLREAPKKVHEEAAIDRIIEIEDGMDIAGKEALEDSTPALLFDYISRFPRGQEIGPIQDQINDQMMDPFTTDFKQGKLKTESHSLLLQSFTKLKPEESFSLDRYYRFGENLLKLAAGNIKHIGAQVFSMTLMLVMLAVLGLMFTVLFQRLGWSIGRLKYVLIAVGIVMSYRLMLAAHFFRVDRNYCAKTYKELRRGLVRLKVAFLLHDNLGINKILMSFMTANTRLTEIKSLSFVDYLNARKPKKKTVITPVTLPPKKEAEVKVKK